MSALVPLLALICAALAFALLVEAVLLGGNKRLHRRLANAPANGESRIALRRLSPRPVTGDLSELAVRLLGFAPVRVLDHLAGRAGLTTPIEHLAVGLALSLLVGMLAMPAVIRLPFLLAVPAGALLAGLAWLLVLNRMAARRTARFGQQLPEALALISRSLRVGHPLATAISLVAREMPAPLGREFGVLFDEMTYGQDLKGALGNLCSRIDGRELRYMAVAISIQHGTGGNLADLLDRLAGVLRDIERMHRKVKALSAEGRLSAWVLSVLPFLVAFGIAAVVPGYYDPVFGDPPFLAVLGGGGLGILLGAAIMMRMVKFRF